jgi:hypothetical protein
MRTFTVREVNLAAGLLPGKAMLATVQRLREESLTVGQDYIKNGRSVLYSAAGVERMAALMRRSVGAGADGGYEDKGQMAPGAPEVSQGLQPSQELMEQVLEVLPKRSVRVVKIFAANPHYLHAVTSDEKAILLTVRVRDNRNFMPGMEMEVLKSVGGVWDFVGHLPRSRGRW